MNPDDIDRFIQKRDFYYSVIKARPTMDDGVFYAPYVPKIMKQLPESKYRFSPGQLHIAYFNWEDTTEVLAWCEEMFGRHPVAPDAWSRWQKYSFARLRFRDAKDYEWFVLRWGS